MWWCVGGLEHSARHGVLRELCRDKDSSEVSTKMEVLASPNSLSCAQASPGAACGTIRNDEALSCRCICMVSGNFHNKHRLTPAGHRFLQGPRRCKGNTY